MAQTPSRITNLFVNSGYPKEGLIALNLHVKGKPAVITIDDYLPFEGSNLYFAMQGSDGSFWAPFIEKAFAKLEGNYENIQGGW